jgi:hypothetical protein
MTTIKTIPVECLGGLDVQEGDTLRILASRGNELVVVIRRDTGNEQVGSGSISEWLRIAKGSVKLEPGESADEARMDNYSKKYGIDS